MTLLFCDSFAHYVTADLPKKWQRMVVNPAYCAINATAGRRGGPALQIGAGGNGTSPGRALGAGYATLAVGFAWKTQTVYNGHYVVAFYEGATEHGRLQLNTVTNKVAYVSSGPNVSYPSADSVIAPNTWAYIEVKVIIHDTAGSVEVRVNGVTVINQTGIDTRNAGTAGLIDGFVIGPANFDPGPGFATNFCDLYVCDASGGFANGFLGDVRVDALFPSAAGTTTQLAPTGVANNWDAVNDVAEDADATYVSSATAGQYDTYAMQDHPSGAAPVYGVQVATFARKDDAGSRTLAPMLRAGSIDYQVGAGHSVGDTYDLFLDIQATNPNTAAQWTLAGLNAAEVGVKVVS